MAIWPYPWESQLNPLVIPPGFLRNQVQIQRPSGDKDDFGQPLDGWTIVLTAMAGIISLVQREVWQNGMFSGQVTHRVTLRWPGPDVTIASGMRVVFGSRTFVVQAPPDNVQERNRVLHLLCLEIDGGGVGGGQGCS